MYDNYKLFFCCDGLQNCDPDLWSYLFMIFMLNNGIRKIIYDTYKLVFCHDKLPNYNLELLSNLFKIFYVEKWYKGKYLWQLEARFSSW